MTSNDQQRLLWEDCGNFGFDAIIYRMKTQESGHAWGARGRWFKSSRADQHISLKSLKKMRVLGTLAKCSLIAIYGHFCAFLTNSIVGKLWWSDPNKSGAAYPILSSFNSNFKTHFPGRGANGIQCDHL